VACTIWAPVTATTTWTVVPVTLLPSAGLVIESVAGEAGRLGGGVPGGTVAEMVGLAVGGGTESLPHPAHAAIVVNRTARTAAVRAVLMDRILILGR
jgi:hypothetical protein